MVQTITNWNTGSVSQIEENGVRVGATPLIVDFEGAGVSVAVDPTNANRVIVTISGGGPGGGDVTGPGVAVDNALARFNGPTGKIIQNSVAVLSDLGALTGLTGLTTSGVLSSTGTLSVTGTATLGGDLDMSAGAGNIVLAAGASIGGYVLDTLAATVDATDIGLAAHVADVANPHSTTAVQVGAPTSAGISGGQTLNGGTAAANNLTLVSTTNVTKGYVSADGFRFSGASSQALAPTAGTASLPSWSWVSDPNTGIWNYNADAIGFTTGGTTKFTIESTIVTSTLPFQGADGSAANPALSFSADGNTGFYRVGADQIGASTGGTLRVTLSTTLVTSTLPFAGPDGSAAAPAFTIASDPDSGLYSAGANQLGWATGGTSRMTLSTTVLDLGVLLEIGVGSVSAPSLYFDGDSDTGIYQTAANQLAITCAATQSFVFGSTGVTAPLPVRLSDGSASAPGLTWNSDTNTGIWRSAADTLRIATNAVDQVFISTASFRVSQSTIIGVSGVGTAPDFTLDVRGETAIVGSSTSTGRWMFRGIYASGSEPANPGTSQGDMYLLNTAGVFTFKVRYNDAGTVRTGSVPIT